MIEDINDKDYIDFAKEVLDYERKEKTRNSDGLQAR